MSDETKQHQAGRELDALIARRLTDKNNTIWHDSKDWIIVKKGMAIEQIPHYSTDIAAAFELVDFARSKGYRFHLYEHDRKSPGDDFIGWVAGFTSREPMKMNSQWQGETRPLAICRAFLALELE